MDFSNFYLQVFKRMIQDSCINLFATIIRFVRLIDGFEGLNIWEIFSMEIFNTIQVMTYFRFRQANVLSIQSYVQCDKIVLNDEA